MPPWPGGPGFWLVTRHADVQTVMSRPETRDPATPAALRYVPRMMVNRDPPDHTRLRHLLTRSFTPRAVAQLNAGPAHPRGRAVEESLRWWTPVMTFRRTATTDCRLGEVNIPAGRKVVVSFTSANRDEAVFAGPDRFDIRRRPNPHLAFGYGLHSCLGAHLARVQMRALFAEVLARMGRLEYDGRPAFLRSNFQRGVKRLPVRWSRPAESNR